jgi:hypothetical protein
MRVIATADVGGTHARFALAAIDDCQVVDLGEPVTVKTGEFASFQHAWQEFGRRIEQPLPKELAIAFAGPVGGDVLKLTNNPWVIRPALMFERLGVERFVIVNDFAAIAHAVAGLDASAYRHVCGPERGLPDTSRSTDTRRKFSRKCCRIPSSSESRGAKSTWPPSVAMTSYPPARLSRLATPRPVPGPTIVITPLSGRPRSGPQT